MTGGTTQCCVEAEGHTAEGSTVTDDEWEAHGLRASESQQSMLREHRDAFTLLDKDGDGYINTKELGMVVRALGQNPSEVELSQMIAEVDEDNSGQIDFPEFVNLLSHTMVIDSMEAVVEAFEVIDRDGSGGINLAELRAVVIGLGQELGDEEIADMLSEFDTDGDGQISRQEFVDVLLGLNI